MMTKLLLVEDDIFFGDLVKRDLYSLFPHGELQIIGPVESFFEALSVIKSERPDIALLDINLGSKDDTSGIRIAEFLNRNHAIPIIFLSGMPHGLDQAKYTLPIAYLRKPYRKQDLQDQIELQLVRLSMKNQLLQEELIPKTKEKKTLFVTINRGELVPIRFDQLILLEADGKVIRAHVENSKFPIVFTSPGLKNFFKENLSGIDSSFFQMSRKYVINISKITRIKDNHVYLENSDGDGRKIEFQIQFPVNNNMKNEFLKTLSRNS